VELGYANYDGTVRALVIKELGWHDGQAVGLTLLGAKLTVCVVPVREEIERRSAEQLPPMVDPWLFRCHADMDPGFLSRPAPVRLLGALALRKTWASARGAASTFTAFGPRAVVLPPQACLPTVLTEATVTGMGVVRWDGRSAVLLATPRQPPTAPRTHVHRLVEEIVWDAVSREKEQATVPPRVAVA
jgi:hypothetical protein